MIDSKQKGPHGTPDFIDILSIDDKISYEKLQEKVGSSKYRYNRNHRITTLIEIFGQIKEYCDNKELDKWKRCLVCGICWFGDYLAINTRQLRFLISKSKSSINDVLLKMGYKTVSVKGEPGSLLIESIPFLFGNQIEFRKWSIRRMINNKNIKCLSDNDDCCNDIIDSNKNETDNEFDFVNFSDDINSNKNETDNEFKFVNFGDDINSCKNETDNEFDFSNLCDNVDDNFDFNFGYDGFDDSCLIKCCNNFSFDNNKEFVVDNNVLNCKFEGSTKVC